MYEVLVNDLLDAAKVDKGTSTSKLLERAVEAIERLEERVAIMSVEPDMQWVDAKRRLPEKGVEVIGAVFGHDLLVAKPGEDLLDTLRRTRREVRYTALASVDDEEGQLMWYGADGYLMMVQPSFWMALPEIPRGR